MDQPCFEVVVQGRQRTASATPRSFAPREHGAYGELILPLLAAHGMGRPDAGAALLTIGAVAAFFAHEPLLVATGQRGSRAVREDGGRARQRLALLGTTAALAGGAGLWLAPPAARLAAVLPVGLSLLLAPFILRGGEKTTLGELLAAAALPSAALPVALSAGVAPGAACGAAVAWFLVFSMSTIVVRTVIAHARASVAWPRRLAAPAIAALAALALAARGALLPAAAIGAAPMLVLALVFAVRPPAPRSLRRVGWALVATSVALALALALGAPRPV